MELRVKKRAKAHVDVDALPSTEAFNAEIREAWFVMLSLPRLYKAATDAASWPPGGMGVRVTGGSEANPTRETAMDLRLQAERKRIKAAVKWMRSAAEAAGTARAALVGNQVEQPKHVAKRGATMTQAEFEKRIKRQQEVAAQSFSPDTP